MSTGTLVAGPLPKIGRQELEQVPVPEATLTHKPVPHHIIVEALVETLSHHASPAMFVLRIAVPPVRLARDSNELTSRLQSGKSANRVVNGDWKRPS